LSEEQGLPEVMMQIHSPDELAHAVRTHIYGKRDLSPLPWNRHEPKTTLWWLTPSRHNPAYADGKFVFSLARDDPRRLLAGRDDALIELGTLFVGVNFEKGFGPAACQIGTPRPHSDELLGPEWVWHQLIEGHGPEQFALTLTRLSEKTGKVHLYVSSGTARDSADTRTVRPLDCALFDCVGDRLDCRLHNRFPDGTLHELSVETSRTFSELATKLRTVDDFHWVDVYAGSYVPKGEVDLSKLHADVLSYLEPWIRSGYAP
jgi:hypothetical protein